MCQPCSYFIKTVSGSQEEIKFQLKVIFSCYFNCCRAALLTGHELKYAVRSHLQWFWESNGDFLKSTPHQVHYYLLVLVQNLIVAASDMNKGLFGFGCRSCDWAAVAVLSFLLVLGFPSTLKACTLGWLETLNCTQVLKCDWQEPSSGLSLTRWPIIPSFMASVFVLVLCTDSLQVCKKRPMQQTSFSVDFIHHLCDLHCYSDLCCSPGQVTLHYTIPRGQENNFRLCPRWSSCLCVHPGAVAQPVYVPNTILQI